MKKQRGKPIIPERPFPRRKVPLPPLPEKLTRSEKRRQLAQIVRFNLLDCFDDSGALDLERIRRLPGAAIQQFVVHETTRTDRQGNSVVQRRVTLRLVDKVRAMKYDDELLEAEEDDQPEEISEEERKHQELYEKKNRMFIQWKESGNYPDGPPPPGYDELWEDPINRSPSPASPSVPSTLPPARPPPPSRGFAA
jgi:hypothetical protein